MDWVAIGNKIRESAKNYRLALLILILGIFLMLLPTGESKSESPSVPEKTDAFTAKSNLESSLSEILSAMDGAGKVQVLLTQAQGEQILYQTDDNRSQSDTGADLRQQTVILSGADRSEFGLVRQTIPPVYQGAIILCQGADSAAVRLAIIQAVANATGLSTDKISVLKMK